MELNLHIDMDNAAFGDDDDAVACCEASQILREAAQRIRDGAMSGKLRDSNGNTVGSFEISK